jgi:cell wall-associated NlpC family hydrolase
VAGSLSNGLTKRPWNPHVRQFHGREKRGFEKSGSLPGTVLAGLRANPERGEDRLVAVAAGVAVFPTTAPATTAASATAFATFSAATAAPTTTATSTTTTAIATASATAAAAPVSTATATTATAVSATTTTTTLTGRALFAGAGDVDGERPTAKLLAMEQVHGALGFFGRGELNEGEAA